MPLVHISTNMLLLQCLLKFYSTHPELDIKDNKYCLYFLKYYQIEDDQITDDLIRRTTKMIMLIRVSILEEHDILKTILMS